MTFRVVNLTTGEILAELHRADHAVQLADTLAAEQRYEAQFAVVQLVTVYETPIRGKTP
ncbi:aminoglycoside phosphotransferase (APT) family kinase protein [Bradyrhizobium barranii subsp. barranii]|uniref:Uncharacterized protein n=1 Tax=Bradyrhizobium barranii subsp. barranii TaxID=2823807 RepID=A0A939MEE9_9BRAD|nr:hypothetical protein [Bradyrhizobium barranii]UEM11909.1 hypothetical protein J4G43_046960 [Bradyrhizobium barranii subsp. barranii]